MQQGETADWMQERVKRFKNSAELDRYASRYEELMSIDNTDGESIVTEGCIHIMTYHASKGLEFNTVFIIGAQEGSFPHKNAIATCTQDAIEEERTVDTIHL